MEEKLGGLHSLGYARDLEAGPEGRAEPPTHFLFAAGAYDKRMRPAVLIAVSRKPHLYAGVLLCLIKAKRFPTGGE